MRAAQASAKAMVAAGKGGSIIDIASVLGMRVERVSALLGKV